MADGTGTDRKTEPDVATLKSELADEKRRTAALAARNSALEAQRRGNGSDAGQKRPRRRHRALVALLLALGFVLTPVTIVVLYAHTQLTDTGRYVATIKPLADDPAVQAYAADQVTSELFANVDVNAYVRDALPDRAQSLAAPLAGALRTFTHEATLRVLQSKQFQTLWVEANRAAHAQINNVLSGARSGTVTSNTNGTVSLDLSQVAQRVKQRLEATGIGVFSKIPADKVSGKITIFHSAGLYKARRAYSALNRIAFVLPFIVFAAFGGAILLSANRRRGFMKAAVTFTLGALFFAILLTVVRGIYLNGATTNGIPHDAAAAVYDAVVKLLQRSMRSILAFSIVVVVAAFFAGPSRLAVSFRARARNAALWLGQQSDTAGWTVLGPSRFVVEHKGGLRIVIAAVGFIVLFAWNRPTPMVILWLAVLVLLALATVEFLGRELTRRDDAGHAVPA